MLIYHQYSFTAEIVLQMNTFVSIVRENIVQAINCQIKINKNIIFFKISQSELTELRSDVKVKYYHSPSGFLILLIYFIA